MAQEQPKQPAKAKAQAVAQDVPKVFEPEALYKITVNRVCKVHDGATILRPSALDILVKGKIATQIADAIVTAEKV